MSILYALIVFHLPVVSAAPFGVPEHVHMARVHGAAPGAHGRTAIAAAGSSVQ